MKVFYSDAYVGAGENFDTMRKSGWIAESLRSDPIDGAQLVEPAPATASDLTAVHDPRLRRRHPPRNCNACGLVADG